MACRLLLLFALLFFALGLLTACPSPDWNPWQLAVLAGEFGHGLVIVPFLVAVGAWATRASGGAWWPVTVVVSLMAMALLLKPTVEARRVGRMAAAELDRIGAPASESPAFSLAGFFRRNRAAGAISTFTYSPGLEMDFYPAEGLRPAPCVIVVHGGGWDNGDRKQLPGLNHWLAKRGYAVAAINYRLAPSHRWPAQREDVLAAIAFLKAKSADLGIDPTRLVLFGRSAGGQIAEVVAYTAHDPAIRGLVAFYAPSDLRFAYKYARDDDVLKSPSLIRRFLGGPPEEAGEAYDSASALPQVGADSPPTLLIHGEIDTLVWHRHSVRLEALLERSGVPCVLVSLPWATHAFDVTLAGPGGQLATYALGRFLARVTGRTR